MVIFQRNLSNCYLAARLHSLNCYLLHCWGFDKLVFKLNAMNHSVMLMNSKEENKNKIIFPSPPPQTKFISRLPANHSKMKFNFHT
jgi:hypothetical protein